MSSAWASEAPSRAAGAPWAAPAPRALGLGVLQRLLDLGSVFLGLSLACHARAVPLAPEPVLAGLCAAVLYLLAAERRRVYRSWRLGGLAQEAGSALAAWFGALLGLAGVAYLLETPPTVPRDVTLAWAVVTPCLQLAWRLPLRQLARGVRASGHDLHRAVVVGTGPVAVRVAETIRREPWMGVHLEGRCADDPDAFRGLLHRAREGTLDVVYLALWPQHAHVKQLVRELADTTVAVHLVPDLSDLTLLRARGFTFGSLPTISLFDPPFGPLDRLLKRVEDVALGSVCLALAALPMLLIAIAIRLDSPGPVLFKQRRHGLGGREILVWKFRTMTVCEEGAAARQARRGDPRVTRLGRLLRANSLDELPQLVNVLQGRMSLVGPRPHPLALDREHRGLIDGYGLRQRVKPGLTGWAQVCGFRGETDTVEKMQQRIEHDLAYIETWSLWLDLKILVLTLFRGWTGNAAY